MPSRSSRKPTSRAGSPMAGAWKEQWRAFSRAGPGHRFRDFHQHQRKTGIMRHWWGRLLFWLGGLVLLFLAAFLAVAPGPATIFVVPGALLIACVSKVMARVLDWIDCQLAPLMTWMARQWRRWPRGLKVAARVFVGASAIAGLVGGFFLMR